MRKMQKRLNSVEQEHLDRLLSGQDQEALEELICLPPVYLKEIEEKIDWADKYCIGQHKVYQCSNGKYYEIVYTQDNEMGDIAEIDFYEVVPIEITKFIYEPKKEN